MKSFLGVINIAYTILLLVLLTKLGVAENEHDKNRRGANLGLYAFPRVGRSDPSLANRLRDASDAFAYESIYGLADVSLEDFEDYQKRNVFIPNPNLDDKKVESYQNFRKSQGQGKRTGPSASSGLWFGPRLGKRSVNAKDYPGAAKGQKELY